MKSFCKSFKELGLYPVVNGKMAEGDMIRTEFQNDHSGFRVEIRLTMEADLNQKEELGDSYYRVGKG